LPTTADELFMYVSSNCVRFLFMTGFGHIFVKIIYFIHFAEIPVRIFVGSIQFCAHLTFLVWNWEKSIRTRQMTSHSRLPQLTLWLWNYENVNKYVCNASCLPAAGESKLHLIPYLRVILAVHLAKRLASQLPTAPQPTLTLKLYVNESGDRRPILDSFCKLFFRRYLEKT